MTNLDLDALEKMADAATKHPECRSTYITVEATAIKLLIARQRELEALCKLQHSVLNAMAEITCIDHRDGTSTIIACDIPKAAKEALTAYEQMNGGE